ncbi:hypothetical protein G5I_13861 [Acromyrmex echinatior]|uniref:Uncharacterized protein n=1 Tax=Acromyrmex echinatior TaxID=103372 RepID=F4X657_ACREC|nr:hypothetical protein G5I_13861 [Acromyrmex echinatior]
MEDRFCQLKWQGIPCGLAHTAPFSGTSWPRKARDLTRFLINQQEGRMSILGIIKNETTLIKLEIRSGVTQWTPVKHSYNIEQILITVVTAFLENARKCKLLHSDSAKRITQHISSLYALYLKKKIHINTHKYLDIGVDMGVDME